MEPRRKVLLVGVVLGVVAVALILGSFGAGFVAGYSRGTGVPVLAQLIDTITHRGPGRGLSDHGAMGSIVSVNGNILTLKARDGSLKEIGISEKTIIRRDRNAARASDLKPGDFIVVVGSPGSRGGTLDSRLIRVLPLPPPLFHVLPFPPPQSSVEHRGVRRQEELDTVGQDGTSPRLAISPKRGTTQRPTI